MKSLKLIVTLFCLFIASCASFPEEKIAKVNKLPDVSQFKNKPTVSVDLKFFRGKPENENAVEVTQVQPNLQKLTSEILDEAQLFESYSFDVFEQESADYVVKLHFYNHGSNGGAAISGFLSGLTMGVIPGFAQDKYTLKVEVMKGDKNILSQTSDDALNTYIGIWFIPVMGNTPEKGFNAVISNMIKDSLLKLIESKQLEYAHVTRPVLVTNI